MKTGRWDDTEIEQFIRLIQDKNNTLDVIATELKRDRVSVARKIQAIGLDIDTNLKEEARVIMVDYDRKRRQSYRDLDRANAETKKAKKMWTNEEDLVLLELVEEDYPIKEIRWLLGRTVISIHNRCRLLNGLTSKDIRDYEANFTPLQKASHEVSGSDRWNASKDKKLINLIGKGTDIIALTSTFKSPPGKLYTRYNYLKSIGRVSANGQNTTGI